jgi:hypothetical protein
MSPHSESINSTSHVYVAGRQLVRVLEELMKVMVLLFGAQGGAGSGKVKLAMGWGRMQMVLVIVSPGHGEEIVAGGGIEAN